MERYIYSYFKVISQICMKIKGAEKVIDKLLMFMILYLIQIHIVKCI